MRYHYNDNCLPRMHRGLIDFHRIITLNLQQQQHSR